MESYIVFDPSIVTVNQSGNTPATATSGSVLGKPGVPEIQYSHIIPITRDGTVDLLVYRILEDGSVAPIPGFREEKNKDKALAEAAAGKLVLRLATPW